MEKSEALCLKEWKEKPIVMLVHVSVRTYKDRILFDTVVYDKRDIHFLMPTINPIRIEKRNNN